MYLDINCRNNLIYSFPLINVLCAVVDASV